MKFSIVTITYQNFSGMQRTIASVRAQKGVDIDHIVVDGDADTDMSDEPETVYERPGYRMRMVRRCHRGVYDALNAGMAHAQGDIIGILHAGDTFTTDKVLSRIAEVFEGADNAPDFIYGDVHFARPGRSVVRYYSGSAAGFRSILEGFAPPHLSLYLTSSCARLVGPYDESFKVAGDFDMFVRLLRTDRWKGKYVPMDMVEMQPGGLSARWYNRLFVNNQERMRALRRNGQPASWLRIALHYVNVLEGYIWKKK